MVVTFRWPGFGNSKGLGLNRLQVPRCTGEILLFVSMTELSRRRPRMHLSAVKFLSSGLHHIRDSLLLRSVRQGHRPVEPPRLPMSLPGKSLGTRSPTQTFLEVLVTDTSPERAQ